LPPAVLDVAASEVFYLSQGERSDRVAIRVSGYGLPIEHNPSPGAARRPLPMGEVETEFAATKVCIAISRS
jgi:hypothetical protein